MERLVVGVVDFFITIYRGTVVRLTAVGDAIVSLGRRISRRQPSTGVQVIIYFNIFFVESCIKLLWLLYQRARRRMTSQSGKPLLSPNQKIVRLFGGRSSDQ